MAEAKRNNLAVDRLEWLLARRRIDLAQHAAGRRLQRDCELAAIGLYAPSPELLRNGRRNLAGSHLLSDAKCDAIARVNAARAHVGATGFRILELVAVENLPLSGVAKQIGELDDRLPLALCVALDALASFYRLA